MVVSRDRDVPPTMGVSLAQRLWRTMKCGVREAASGILDVLREPFPDAGAVTRNEEGRSGRHKGLRRAWGPSRGAAAPGPGSVGTRRKRMVASRDGDVAPTTGSQWGCDRVGSAGASSSQGDMRMGAGRKRDVADWVDYTGLEMHGA